MVLQALEFSDCLLDSPHFREKLNSHEKELDNTSKVIKKLILEGKELILAAKTLSKAQKSFSQTLLDFKFECIGNQQTDDEIVIAQSFKSFGNLIMDIESARDKMLNRVNETFIGKMEAFRKEQIGAAKEGHKKFEKTTKQFCQSLEKHLNMKIAKADNAQLHEADVALEAEKKNYHREAMSYVMLLQEVQEKKKYEFVEVVHVFMQGWLTFYHEGHDIAADIKPYMLDLQEKIQLTRESFAATRDEVRNLMNKVLESPEENGPKSKMFTIQGYLYLMEKKALGQITWSKYFCSYQKETKIFSMIPFNQTAGNAAKLDLTPETLVLESCTRRASDTVDRRFCFDITVAGKPAPYTLQATCDDDRLAWMDAMEGTEPIYARPNLTAAVLVAATDGGPECTLDAVGTDFVTACIEAIQARGITDQGLYRVVGVSSKVAKLLQAGLVDSKKSDRPNLLSEDSEWEVKTITSALKHYFRKLPDPIMTFRMHQKFILAAKTENKKDRVAEVDALVHKLPQANYTLLKQLAKHLHNVAACSNSNLMTVSNLGVCFGPTLLRPEEETVAAIMDIKFCNVVVEILIENYAMIFEGACDNGTVTDSSSVDGDAKVGNDSRSPPHVRHQQTGNSVGQVSATSADTTYGKNRRVLRPNSVFTNSASAGTKGSSSSADSLSGAPESGSSIAESLTSLTSLLLVNAPPESTSSSQRGGISPKVGPPRPTDLPSTTADKKLLPPAGVMSRSFTNTMSSSAPDARMRYDSTRAPVKRHRQAPVTAALLAAKAQGAVPAAQSPSHGGLRSARVRTLFACEADNDSELSFEPNQIIYNVRESREPGWLEGTINGKTGLMPANYVTYIEG